MELRENKWFERVLVLVFLFNAVKFMMVFIEKGFVNTLVAGLISYLLLEGALRFLSELEKWKVIAFLSILLWALNYLLYPNI